jgi:tRNA isopentenyl-2-thiomethyl-A-37 hydroxylase MiaE
MSTREQSRIESLLERALQDPWLPARDLPWSSSVSPQNFEVPEEACLIREVGDYRRMSAQQQKAYRKKEAVWALSNLAFGEQRGAWISAQVIVDSAEERPELTHFLGVLVAEEARHYDALHRYSVEKIQAGYAPHPAMRSIFEALRGHWSWELKLMVGQVLFEPTSCAMLCSLHSRVDEPLLTEIIRRIMRDEARHLAFSYSIAESLGSRLEAKRIGEIEDMLFESVVACAAGFLPEAAWAEEGFSSKECRESAVQSLVDRRVLDFFTRTLPEQLARRGFTSGRLEKRLREGLVKELLVERFDS